MDKLFTLRCRYLPPKDCAPWPWWFTEFGGASSWLFHYRFYYKWLHGVVRIFGAEIEWCMEHDVITSKNYYDGLIDQEFASEAPVPRENET
jgi:hypothetical protein